MTYMFLCIYCQKKAKCKDFKYHLTVFYIYFLFTFFFICLLDCCLKVLSILTFSLMRKILSTMDILVFNDKRWACMMNYFCFKGIFCFGGDRGEDGIWVWKHEYGDLAIDLDEEVFVFCFDLSSS